MTMPRDYWQASSGQPDPYDQHCHRYARAMTELDDHIYGEPGDDPDAEPRPTDDVELQLARAQYVRTEEGTYNPENGHFLCDRCYIDAGQPSAPGGWVAP